MDDHKVIPATTARLIAAWRVISRIFSAPRAERRRLERELGSLIDNLPSARAGLRAILALERRKVLLDLDVFIEQLRAQRQLDWIVQDVSKPLALIDGTINESQAEDALDALRAVHNKWSYAQLLSREADRVSKDESTVAESAMRVSRGIDQFTERPPSSDYLIITPQWPGAPIEAYYGLAGKFVELIKDHTEADPVALLIQIIVMFGNVIGRTAFFEAEADRHYLNLFVVLVGLTSKGRKGTSLGHVRVRMASLDENWAKDCEQSGLASGEGLIWAVRDKIEDQKAIKSKGRVTGYETVVSDPGVKEKRLMVVEAEFAQPLKVASREGNILSTVIRQAWDSGNLRTMSKHSPAKATGAHISIIGHITKDELLRSLETTEASNGYANRFLWLCTRRSKRLPEGGKLEDVDFSEVLKDLNDAFVFAKNVERMARDYDAAMLWHNVYEELSEGKPGLLGSVTSRAEAQVMRLACVYALLDQSRAIGEAHLKAALSLWKYCEESAAYVFGARLGDPVADDIFDALQEAGDDGLSREQLRELFSRNRSSEQISRALASLGELNLVESETIRQARGRPVERWRTSARVRGKRGNETPVGNEYIQTHAVNAVIPELPRLPRTYAQNSISETEAQDDDDLGPESRPEANFPEDEPEVERFLMNKDD